MTKRYLRPTVSGWLVPLSFAPFLSVVLAVAAYAFLGPAVPYVPRWATFGVGLVAGIPLALAFNLIQVFVDVVLLAVRVRTLPTGKRAWLTSFLSPFAWLGTYAVLKPWTYWKGGPWTVIGIVLAPMIVVAVVSRVFFGAGLVTKNS